MSRLALLVVAVVLAVTVVLFGVDRPVAGRGAEPTGRAEGRPEARSRRPSAPRVRERRLPPADARTEPAREAAVRTTDVPPQAPLATLHGLVVADPDGKPVDGAMIRVQPAGSETDWVLVAEPDGAFAGEVPATALRLEVTAPEFLPLRARADPAQVGTWSPLRLRLPRAASLHLTVLEPDGRPAAGLRARLVAGGWGGARGDVLREVTDGQGRCCFELQAETPWSLELRGNGYHQPAERTFRLAAGERADVVVSMRPEVTLRGVAGGTGGEPVRRVTLVPATRPVEAYVNTRRGFQLEAECGEDGRFELEHVACGTWWVVADSYAFPESPPGGALTACALAQVLHVTPRTAGHELELRFSPGLSISGLVDDGTDRPVRVIVEASSLDREGDPLTAFTWSEGRFEIRGLAPGRFELRVLYPNASEPVVVSAGERDVRLELRPSADG